MFQKLWSEMSEKNKKSLKETIMNHLANEVYCHLGISPVHGIGVFAVRPIPKGTNPLRSRVKHREISFTHAELKSLPRGVRKQINMFCYYDDDEVLVSTMGLNTMDFAVYLNHSKTPNIRFNKDGSCEVLRNIKTGEELMMDYDHSFDGVHIFE